MYIAIAAVVGFVLGLVLHRYVLSEANTVKTHITNEFNKLRQDVGLVIEGNGRKMGR